MGAAQVKYDAAIICEQVRQEANGKFILIGAVPSELAVPTLPAQVIICIYTEGLVSISGSYISTARLVDNDGIVLSFQPPAPPVKLVVGRFVQVLNFSFTIHRECTITAVVNDGGKDHTLLTREVTLLKTPLPPYVGSVLRKEQT
jgi:hypothetical protein